MADMVTAPQIITTAPTTHESDEPAPKNTIRKLFFPGGASGGGLGGPFRKSAAVKQTRMEGMDDNARAVTSSGHPPSTLAVSEPVAMGQHAEQLTHEVNGTGAPPAYGDETTSQLAIPIHRLSDSSRSDASSTDHHVYARTTTTHTILTTTTFFKLKRKKRKDRGGHLFPLPERFPTPASGRSSLSRTPGESTSGRKSTSPGRESPGGVRFDITPSNRSSSPALSPALSTVALTNAPFGTPGPTIIRQESALSTHSGHSGHSTPSLSLFPPRTAGGRGRSSTLSSLGRSAEKLVEGGNGHPPLPSSTRTSTSTNGRRSFGDLLSLPHRLRQNSAPPPRYGGAMASPTTPASKTNSLQIPREAEPELVYPKREDGDTPASYIEKLEAAVPRGAMATVLCKSADDFSKTCLRKYMRGFSYFGDSIDMAIRKMLMEVELPKETQQIDRLLAGFADRYYECNPGIFASTDEAAFIAFSILLLHSDTHNKNNKRKMQKHDYVKNTQQGPVQVSSDILDCFYDNVCYTPFIHFEDEVAINSHRLTVPRPKRSLIKTKSIEGLRGGEPVDPYTLILDNKLDVLRPPLKDVMDTEDTYSSGGTGGGMMILDSTSEVHKAFAHSSILQIVSARSRPEAFMTLTTIFNPGEAEAGLVSIKVAKVGLLWRKDPKKKKAKRPWQEWGAILTDSKLYFFKDVGWVKKLVTQYDAHSKLTGRAGSVIFKPPLSSFDPDALISMDDAVALIDASYKKHKNAFTFIKHGGFEEIFLANSEAEMNDWIGKLNYAATFRTAGVRMRGLLGTTNYEGRHLLRKGSDFSTMSADSQSTKDTSAPGPSRKPDPQTAWEIMYYRRQLISQKISEFDDKLAVAQRELDHLLRNARHLLILLPIQQKTREAVVLAAGRMSAKLKWTRIELWRTKTHRDILVKDLEQEGPSAFPVPSPTVRGSSVTTTPQKTTTTTLKSGPPQTLDRSISETSNPMTLSPTSSSYTRQPSNGKLERLKTDNGSTDAWTSSSFPESSTVDLPSFTSGSPALVEDQFTARNDHTNPESHSLVHQSSIVSRTPEKERYGRGPDDNEDQVQRDSGLVGVDGAVWDKRPDTSESDRDRVGAAISPTSDFTRDRGSVRRSLHRTLRDPHIRDAHQGHHPPSLHRHRKGRDSASSSLAPTEDGVKSISGDSDELRRGTGSFILHGKKASVITMSSEWQTMSNEDRMRMRNAASATGATMTITQDGLKKGKPDTVADEDAVETVSTASRPVSAVGDGEFESVVRSASRKPSIATTAGEQFVDAETGHDDYEEEQKRNPLAN